jgi:hypothetical protein
MAFDFDSAIMGAENGLGNREAHPGAMQKALLAPAIKFVEDVNLFRVINSLPLIGDAYQQPVGSKPSANVHR